MTQSQTWFPGKDFPDREKWLDIRRTTKPYRGGRLVYAHPGIQEDGEGNFFQPARKPLMIGVNEAKRKVDARPHVMIQRSNDRHPHLERARQEIVRQRHAYYWRREA